MNQLNDIPEALDMMLENALVHGASCAIEHPIASNDPSSGPATRAVPRAVGVQVDDI